MQGLVKFTSIKIRCEILRSCSLTLRELFVATVTYEGQVNILKLYVVDGGSAPLLGRDWLERELAEHSLSAITAGHTAHALSNTCSI